MENGVLIKPLLEKADNFLQLALDFVVIVLESLSGVVGVVELDLEEVCSLANPERVDDAERVAYIVDKPVLIAGPLALQPMCGALPMMVVIVIGEWRIVSPKRDHMTENDDDDREVAHLSFEARDQCLLPCVKVEGVRSHIRERHRMGAAVCTIYGLWY